MVHSFSAGTAESWAKLSCEKPSCVESETKSSLFEYKIDDFAFEDRE